MKKGKLYEGKATIIDGKKKSISIVLLEDIDSKIGSDQVEILYCLQGREAVVISASIYNLCAVSSSFEKDYNETR